MSKLKRAVLGSTVTTAILLSGPTIADAAAKLPHPKFH